MKACKGRRESRVGDMLAAACRWVSAWRQRAEGRGRGGSMQRGGDAAAAACGRASAFRRPQRHRLKRGVSQRRVFLTRLPSIQQERGEVPHHLIGEMAGCRDEVEHGGTNCWGRRKRGVREKGTRRRAGENCCNAVTETVTGAWQHCCARARAAICPATATPTLKLPCDSYTHPEAALHPIYTIDTHAGTHEKSVHAHTHPSTNSVLHE
eukprot:365328-Chlamydomonas_euryale.AAC.15